MSKKISLIILLILCLSLQSIAISGGSLRPDDQRIRLGKVVEIVDGEVIKVYFFHNKSAEPTIETVKLIGIDSDASVEAFNYTSNRLLGHVVHLIEEDLPGYTPTDMTHAYVYYDLDQTVAEELLELGFAKVDDTYKASDQYHSFLQSEYNAKLYEEGMWSTSLSETTDRINLNTVTPNQLSEILDISTELSTEVMLYRGKNPFDDITEIMAVDPSFNGEWFDENNHLLSVITNVNKSSYLEFTSLMGTSSNYVQMIDDIDYYTRFNEVKDLDELKVIKSFSGYYPLVKEFLTLKPTNTFIDSDVDKVNVNTCGLESFKDATRLTAVDYHKLVELRDDYFIRTIGELYRGSTVFPSGVRQYYNAHVSAYTDINNANEHELMSLFDQSELSVLQKKNLAQKITSNRPFLLISELESVIGTNLYDLIEPYTYVFEADIPDYYNKSLIDDDRVLVQLEKKYEKRSSRFTNINQVSTKALFDLHEHMNGAIVSDIVDYRDQHDFWYLDDLRKIFDEHDRMAVYQEIYKYIVFE